MFDNPFIFIAICIVCLVSIIFGTGFLIQWSVIHVYDVIPCEVYVDSELVYKGISAGVEVDTSGANTTVTIMGGFMYLFPQKYYVSANVKVVGVK